MKVTDKHIFFWGGVFGNFYRCTIPYNGYKFYSSEQLFMYLKAKTFNDDDSMELILKTAEPKDAKKLGRKVKNFDAKLWEKHREDCMYIAVYNKFFYNSLARNQLLLPEYADKSFVEASPYDKIWGIGLDKGDPRILDESEWLGMNLLGKVLNEVRRNLR